MTFDQLQQFLDENPTKRVSSMLTRGSYSVRVSDVVSKASWNAVESTLEAATAKALSLSLGSSEG